MSNNYSPQQRTSIAEIEYVVDQLIRLDTLIANARNKPGELENMYLESYYANYDDCEKTLRNKITEAEELGLRNDPIVKKYKILSTK